MPKPSEQTISRPVRIDEIYQNPETTHHLILTYFVLIYFQEDCLTVLEGHRAAVRGLLWNPEIPGILMSGSWDYSLRMWDIR